MLRWVQSVAHGRQVFVYAFAGAYQERGYDEAFRRESLYIAYINMVFMKLGARANMNLASRSGLGAGNIFGPLPQLLVALTIPSARSL